MRSSTAIMVTAILALGTSSIWSWRELRNQRARADALQEQIARLENAPRVTTEVKAPSTSPHEIHAGEPQPAAPSDQKSVAPDEWRLLQNAEFREARRRFRHLELKSGHVDLARVVGISDETADRLIGLLVDRELQYLSHPRTNPRNEAEIRARKLEIEQSEYEEDRQIAALIGEANLPRWKSYQASLPVRHQVRELGAELLTSGEPLRADQVEPLIAAIHSERQRVREELIDFNSGLDWSPGAKDQSRMAHTKMTAQLEAAADARLRAKLASILSPRQLETFDDMRRNSRELREAMNEKFSAHRVAN
jgi:hypothetical protein